MKSFLSLKDFFSKHKWSYLFGVLCLLAIDSVQLLVPQIYRNLTDDLQNNLLDMNGVVMYVGLIVASGLFIAFGRFLWRIYILGTSRKLEYHLRKEIFNHLLKLSPSYFNTHKTGDLMAHITNDVNAVRMAIGQGTIMIVDSVFMMILCVVMMIYTANLRLTLISLSTMPFLLFIVNKFGNLIHHRFRVVQESFSDLTDATQESFSGIRVIKSFVQEKLEIEKFSKINADNLKKNLALVKVSGTFHPFIQTVSSLSFLLIIYFGGREVMYNRITLGDFISFNSYLGLLIWPTLALGRVMNIFQRGAASMERINNILHEIPEIISKENPIDLDNVKGKIEFKNVSFKYPGAKVYSLKNVSFILEPGKSLAILGKTGSGKSTIISLLLKLYLIEEGTITLDGVDINDLSLETLRESIGYVPQDNFLFSTSIEENIGFAFNEKIEFEKVESAAKSAEVYTNIIDFPEQFDTVLGERGVTLSGGQKQRTSIARALIKNPSVLVLDDSLSAVDTETEEKILGNLKTIMKDTTTIIISHRTSTAKDCNEIVYLVDGEIKERGSHQDLLNLKGLYADLYEKQLLEEKLSRD